MPFNPDTVAFHPDFAGRGGRLRIGDRRLSVSHGTLSAMQRQGHQ